MKKTISLAVFLVMLLPAAAASGAEGTDARGGIIGLNGTGTESDPYRIGSYIDLMIVSSYHSYHGGAHYLQTNDIIFYDNVDGDVITMNISLTDDHVVVELTLGVSGGTDDAFACVSLNDTVMLADRNGGSMVAAFDKGLLRSKNSVVAVGSVEGNDLATAITFTDIDGTASITAPLNGNFEPIGTKEYPFSGFYDGNGYSIKGVKAVSFGPETAAGLFGYTDDAVLCNIHIDSDAEHASYVISSSVLNVKNSDMKGSVTLMSGGIAGAADRTTIIASSVDCSVSSFLLVISENDKGPGIPASTLNIDMISNLHSGGLIGRGNGSVHDSMNTGVVSSQALLVSRTGYVEKDTAGYALTLWLTVNIVSHTGGIVGRSDGSIAITNTGNTAPVYSSQSCSIEVDHAFDAGVLDIMPKLTIDAVAGGIAGWIHTGVFTNTFNSGDMYTKMRTPFREPGYETDHIGMEYVTIGGSVGIVDGRLNIDRSHNTGLMHSESRFDHNDKKHLTHFFGATVDLNIGDFYCPDIDLPFDGIHEKVIKLSASEMSSADTFTGWDFDRVWIMSDLGYPVLLIRYPVQIADMSHPFDGVPKYFIDLEHDINDEGVISAYAGRTGFTLTPADEYIDRDAFIYALHGERIITLEADGEGRYRIPSPLLFDTSEITLYVDLVMRPVIPELMPEVPDEFVIAAIAAIAVAAALATILNIISAASVLSMSAKTEEEIRKEGS